MILIWGSADDPPVERMLSTLRARGFDVVHIDQRALATLRYDVTLGANPRGRIETGARTLNLDELTGIYLRPGDSTHQAQRAAMTLLGIASSAPVIVVNRPAAGRSNWSKPFQLRLIAAAGFAVPETLVTTDPTAARAFLAQHQRIIYKSVSGIRSIVATLDVADADRLTKVATCPVQFQRWIDGCDVRVHVVGARWFATAVQSEADDYRYASQGGGDVTLTPCDIPKELGKRLIALTQSMGLLVSGIDLRVTKGGEWYCFEVNPSPGFTFYEDATGQPIAAAIADLFAAPAGVVRAGSEPRVPLVG